MMIKINQDLRNSENPSKTVEDHKQEKGHKIKRITKSKVKKLKKEARILICINGKHLKMNNLPGDVVHLKDPSMQQTNQP